MRNCLSSLLIAVCVWLVVGSSIARAAVFTKIDGATIKGELTGIADGQLTIIIPSTQPAKPTPLTGRRVSGATSKPATRPVAKTVTVPMSEIARIVVRDPPVKPQPVKASQPEPDDTASDEEPSVMSSVLGAFFGSSTPRRHSKTVVVEGFGASGQAHANENSKTGKNGLPSSRPSGSPRWQVRLADDNLLNGRIASWADGKVRFKIAAIDGAVIEFPADQLAELWCTDAAAKTKARALGREPGPEDVAFVRKDAEVIAVKGLVQSMDADSLHFRFDDQDRKIALSKLVGFVQGAGERAKAQVKFHQRVRLDSGDEISGMLTAASSDAITLTTTGGTQLRLPVAKVYTIDFVDGRLVYLSDLRPEKVEQTPYFGRVMPWRADQALGGGPLRLSDGEHTRGIAMHTRCLLEYDISGAFERFDAKVGFEQPAGKKGTAIVRVLGDGKMLFENADARGDQPAQAVDLDVKSVRHLTIEADFGKVPEVGGRVIWGDARLLRANLPG
jgi:hypothetical protein